jgi:hypothetical protein
MTEGEWFACDRFDRLADYLIRMNPRGQFVNGGDSRRKLRLVCCALARSVVAFANDERTLNGLAIAEQAVEGAVSEAEQKATRKAIQALGATLQDRYAHAANEAVYHALGKNSGDVFKAATATRWAAIHSKERPCQVAILRDIIGNPFRQVAFSRLWRTDTALTLARQMYDTRDFSAMPILADALQDAGCDNDEILSHCRGDRPHVRGCWVVDLVSGKE